VKYLLVLAVVLIAVWLWRNNRRLEQQEREVPPRAPPPLAPPQDMVRCPVCAVHLPRADALPGPDGQLYCCQEHRLRSGDR
jgi:uncharacterized protein